VLLTNLDDGGQRGRELPKLLQIELNGRDEIRVAARVRDLQRT
jgi:hypothetical protein